MLTVLRWASAAPPAVLVVLCHGYSGDASQMEPFVEAWAPALPSAGFLAPDGIDVFEQFPLGRQWFSLKDRTPSVLEAGARRAAPALNETIDHELDRLGLGPERVVLAGFSQGAMMVLHAGLRRRPAPAAILAYAGALLDTADLPAEGGPSVLLVHGEADAVVPFERGPEAETILRRKGLQVATCWLPGVEHVVDEAGLAAGLAFVRQTLGATMA